MAQEKALISIVTATFNSERYLEATINSILSQNYPNLEYIIIDGGSSDGTLDIIRQHESQLAYWISEPDTGMYDAIEKGFAQSSGDIMAWLNSDDMYMAWTFQTIAAIFASLPNVEWISSTRPMILDEENFVTECMLLPGFSKTGFMRGENMSGTKFAYDSIQQESTFWRRSLWERAGGQLDTSLKLAGDFELWARFFQHAELYGVRVPLAGFRTHEAQLTANYATQYSAEAQAILQQYGGKPHSSASAFGRKHIAPLVPKRLRRIAARAGIVRPTRLCVFDQTERIWKIREDYL